MRVDGLTLLPQPSSILRRATYNSWALLIQRRSCKEHQRSWFNVGLYELVSLLQMQILVTVQLLYKAILCNRTLISPIAFSPVSWWFFCGFSLNFDASHGCRLRHEPFPPQRWWRTRGRFFGILMHTNGYDSMTTALCFRLRPLCFLVNTGQLKKACVMVVEIISICYLQITVKQCSSYNFAPKQKASITFTIELKQHLRQGNRQGVSTALSSLFCCSFPFK